VVFVGSVLLLSIKETPKITAHSIAKSCRSSWIAMDSDKLEQLENLMREARESGELESTLAAASVFPMPKRPNHKNVPLAEYNRVVLACAKVESTTCNCGCFIQCSTYS